MIDEGIPAGIEWIEWIEMRETAETPLP